MSGFECRERHMALYVYPSERFLEDTREDGIPTDKVLALADQLERAQSTDRFDTFSYPYLIKTQWDYQRRLIAAEVEYEGHLVLIFLRLLVRGNLDCQRFYADARVFMQSTLEQAIEELPAWFQLRTAVSPPPELPGPDDAQIQFLWAQHAGSTTADSIVCEAKGWIEATREQRIKDRLVLLPNLLLSLIGHTEPQSGTAECPVDPRLKVTYRWLPPTPRDAGRLLLLAVNFDSVSTVEAEESKLLGTATTVDHSNVTRIAHRSYPAEICCDDNLWMDIQRDEASNLSLSPEEVSLLESVRALDGTGGFPMFINGRAGSGKSTLLQYVFADYFRAWLEQVEPRDGDATSVPLYLASSHDLLNNAARHVRGLLMANAAQVLQRKCVEPEKLALLQHAFRTPEQYVLEKLAEKGSDVSLVNRVNYPRFRQLWHAKFGRIPSARRDFSPQLSWHVIRTHIKGQSIDGLLEPVDYEVLPRNEQTVTREKYRTVFDRVWKGWYEELCRTDGLWDDQDLALWLSESEWQGRHCALFCDEAQDFTRRQLEALRRCCVFSFLSLSPQEAERVPLVFAGDPFQTLNPTGFRWAAVRAAFTEKLAANMRRYTRRDRIPEIHYEELTYNYRSADQIVRFCNTLQAIRATCMSESGLLPQTTWQLDATAPLPTYFHTGDPSFETALREQTDLILVVPCEEDEEADYVANHPVLQRLVRRDADGTPQNVLSPTRAKGLEFNRVAVVGFASTDEAKSLGRAIREGAAIDDTVDTRLPLEYFLNKLYVACSRARRRLFIVDEAPQLLNDFWSFAGNHEEVDRLAERAPGGAEVWRNNLGGLAMGTPDQWGDDHNDPEETAKRYDDEGEGKKDPYLLLQAALQYEQIGQAQKAADCRGRAFDYDRQPGKAGEWFVRAGRAARAMECFWESGRDSDVVATADTDPSVRGRIEYRLSALLCGRDEGAAAPLDLLREVADRGSTDAAFRARLGRQEWCRAIRDLLDRAHKRFRASTDTAAWGRLADMYRLMGNLGIGGTTDQFADALLRADRLDEVVTLPGLKSDAAPARAARFRLLVARQAADSSASFTQQDCRFVGDEYLAQDALEEAVPWYARAASRDGLEGILERAATKKGHALAGQALRALATILAAHTDWSEIPAILEGRFQRSRSKQSEPFLRSVCEQERIIERVLLPAYATSDTAQSSTPNLKDRLLQPLRAIQPNTAGNWPEDFQQYVKLYGAAVERLGKDIDALEFYERMTADRSIPEPMLHYCEKRWIHCKQRQEQRERYYDRRVTADRHREAIDGKMRTYRWTADDLGPEYPDRRTLGRTQPADKQSRTRHDASTAAGTSAQLGAYTVQTFPAACRINVVSAETGDIVRIDIGRRRVTSTEVQVVEHSDASWSVPDWDLQITLPESDACIRIRAGDVTWIAPESLNTNASTSAPETTV